jgi:hypothetical protein
MLQKIIFRDPGEKEISGIIDLTEKPELSSKSNRGSLKGRSVEQLDEKTTNSTVEKIKSTEKKGPL